MATDPRKYRELEEGLDLSAGGADAAPPHEELPSSTAPFGPWEEPDVEDISFPVASPADPETAQVEEDDSVSASDDERQKEVAKDPIAVNRDPTTASNEDLQALVGDGHGEYGGTTASDYAPVTTGREKDRTAALLRAIEMGSKQLTAGVNQQPMAQMVSGPTNFERDANAQTNAEADAATKRGQLEAHQNAIQAKERVALANAAARASRQAEEDKHRAGRETVKDERAAEGAKRADEKFGEAKRHNGVMEGLASANAARGDERLDLNKQRLSFTTGKLDTPPGWKKTVENKPAFTSTKDREKFVDMMGAVATMGEHVKNVQAINARLKSAPVGQEYELIKQMNNHLMALSQKLNTAEAKPNTQTSTALSEAIEGLKHGEVDKARLFLNNKYFMETVAASIVTAKTNFEELAKAHNLSRDEAAAPASHDRPAPPKISDAAMDVIRKDPARRKAWVAKFGSEP